MVHCMCVYMFVSVWMHMCTGTVSAYMCIHACMHEYVCVCAGLWFDIKPLPSIFYFVFWRQCVSVKAGAY